MPKAELNAEALVHSHGNLSREQGVETQQEKIVVGADAIHFQQLGQNLDQAFFGRRTGRAIAGVLDAIAGGRLGKSGTVQFAV